MRITTIIISLLVLLEWVRREISLTTATRTGQSRNR